MSSHHLSRRQFLKIAALSASGWLLAGCRPGLGGAPATLAATTAAPISTHTPAFTASATAAASAASLPTSTPALLPSASPTAVTPPFKTAVGIQRLVDYNPVGLRRALEQMLADTGALQGVNLRQARVGIKPNLTGGTWWDSAEKPPATELFVTHPAVVQALAELLIDAGASQIYFMDGLGDPTSFASWGYSRAAQSTNAKMVDLCLPAPYSGFARAVVPPEGQVYDRFYLNGLLNELDLFVSVAKMKCHTTTGVTLSLKNLFGIAPISVYRLRESDNHRSAFHGSSKYDTRVPRVIVDLNRTRPIHLAIVDGIITAEAGAGPWDSGLTQVKPGLITLGRDPVAVDCVSAALMGFDPAAPGGSAPFLHADNHLSLAEQAGVGVGNLADIKVYGEKIAISRFLFKPAP